MNIEKIEQSILENRKKFERISESSQNYNGEKNRIQVAIGHKKSKNECANGMKLSHDSCTLYNL